MNNTKDNPLAQDSLPIGTVVEWEGKKIRVAGWNIGGCKDCIFYPISCEAKWCAASKNSDKVERKYILINKQQKEETMNIKLEDGKKYVTEGGEVVTVTLVRGLTSGYPYEGSNAFSYTMNGKLYFNGDNSPNDIVREYTEEVKQELEGHVHAELMLEYGKDALVSKEPWKDWEYSYNYDLKEVWYTLDTHPNWEADVKYRRKPKTILINGYEVPEPIRVAPEDNTLVYSFTLDTMFEFRYFKGYSCEDRLSLGIYHLTPEAAELHAKALLSFTTTV